MTMIERVARAIFCTNFHPDEKTETVKQCWNDWPDDRRKAYAAARAAIEAMREPSKAIIDAADSTDDLTLAQFAQAWHLMLDAALSEQSE